MNPQMTISNFQILDGIDILILTNMVTGKMERGCLL